MDRRDELNAALDPAVVAKIAAHYRHARAKHPEWGEPASPHFVISLGARVELED